MKNFTQRALTAVLFVIVLVGSILWNEYSFGALFLVVSTLGILEFYQLSGKESAQPQRLVGTVINLVLFAGCFLWASGTIGGIWLPLILLPLGFISFYVELFGKSDRPFLNLAFTWLGLLYVGVPFALLNFLVFTSDGSEIVYQFEILLGYQMIIWANDTGAYMVGSAIGSNKLFERVSPGKTWEGTIGGLMIALLAAAGISQLFPILPIWVWVGLGLVISVTATLGDLVESRFKRSINIKDSGTLLPGHGGILDRFDAVLLSAPFVITFLMILHNFFAE